VLESGVFEKVVVYCYIAARNLMRLVKDLVDMQKSDIGISQDAWYGLIVLSGVVNVQELNKAGL
jgi:hypothetical protein